MRRRTAVHEQEDVWDCGHILGGTTESDIDVMVVGDVSFAAVSDALGDLKTDLRREVNPTVYGVPEFTEKISTPFIASVMKKPKVFLIGDEDELARLAG